MGNYYSAPTKVQPVRQFKWKRDTIDGRDLVHNFTVSKLQSTVKCVDLRDKCPPIYDQGTLGSCTANAIAAAYEFDQIKEQEQDVFTPSRLFIYYNEREYEGTVSEDSGAQIRDGIKSINSIGVCPETLWPYDQTKFTTEPTEDCYNDAKGHLAVEYKKVDQTLDQLKQALIEGFPIVFGIVCYPSLQSDEVYKTGIVPMPKPDEQSIGGHAILLCGFQDDKSQFIFRNSWGNEFGDQGYGYIPYDYVTDPKLASDFWTVRRTNDK